MPAAQSHAALKQARTVTDGFHITMLLGNFTNGLTPWRNNMTYTDSNAVYRCAPFLRFAASSGNEILHFPLSGQTAVLSSLEAGALSSWTSFRTLEDQAQCILADIPFLNIEDIRALVATIHHGGSLLSYSSLGEEGPISEQVAHRARIDYLTIPTNGRRDETCRAIKSYARNAEHFNRHYSIFIADDADPGGYADMEGHWVEELTAHVNLPIIYAGVKEKRAFATLLAAGGHIPRHVVDYALFGTESMMRTAGANRNAILLRTVGSQLLSCDDDTLCDLGLVPGSHPASSLAFEGHVVPTEIWCMPDRSAALRFAAKSQVDLVGYHERLLGRDVKALFTETAAAGGMVDCSHACGHLIGALRTSGGLIRSTYCGSRGDCGFFSDIGVVTSPRHSLRARLAGLGDAFDRCLTSRETACQTMSFTISHGDASGIGICFGLDNRSLLPPYMPGFDNEDGTFSALLARCADDAYVGHVPLTVVHDPLTDRQYSDNRDSVIRMTNIMTGAMNMWRPRLGSESMSERLTSLGKHLVSVGRMGEAEFAEVVHVIACSYYSQLLQACESVLNTDAYQVEAWAQTLDKRIAAILDRLERRNDYMRPVDVRCEATADSLVAARDAIGTFGELLMWWPAIVERTTELRHGGVELGCTYTS